MGRAILFLLLAVIVVVVFRPLRERVQPHVQFALDPMYEWSAKQRVGTLRQMIDEERVLGRSVPAPRQFLHFIQQQDPTAGGGIDPWGNPYYLNVSRSTYQVGSAGRDGIAHSADDILSTSGTR